MLRALALVLTVFGTGCAASTAAPPRTVERVVVVPAYAPAPAPPPQHARVRPHHQHHNQACDHGDHAHGEKPKAEAHPPGKRGKGHVHRNWEQAKKDRGQGHVHKNWEQAKKERPGEKSKGDEKSGRDKRAPRAAAPSTPGA